VVATAATASDAALCHNRISASIFASSGYKFDGNFQRRPIAVNSPRSGGRPQTSHRKDPTLFDDPITFYGKVIDQNGDPVPGATVNYTAMDKFDAPGSQYEGKSDANGFFSISGIGSAALSVGVRKGGYYMIHGKSAGAFAYGVGPDSTRSEPPTKDNPAIFVLQKMGIAEPLIPLSTGGIKVPKNGTPVSIDLATGQTNVC
jgi:Carboxypeptidase regulatory-like domain